MSEPIEICDVCDVFDGPHATPKRTVEGPIYLGIKAISADGFLIPEEFTYLSEEDYKTWTKRVIPQENDIVFSYEATLGRYVLIPKGFYGCLGRRLAIIRAKNDKVNIKWLYYYFKSPEWSAFIRNHQVSGSTVDRISIDDFPFYTINLPERNKQDAIVGVLSSIDQKIQLNSRIVAELEAMAKTIYDYWFVQFDFPDENGKPYRSSGGKMEWNKQLKREMPEGWLSCKIGDLLAKVPNSTRIQSTEYLKRGSIPVIDQSDTFIAGYTEELGSIIPSKNGSIIFGDHTRVVKYIDFDFARGADGTQVLISNNVRMPQLLFYYTILKIDLSNYGYARHFKFLKETDVIVPSEYVANHFNDIVTTFHNIITNKVFENIELARLRDWLLPMLMNGQVVVKNKL